MGEPAAAILAVDGLVKRYGEQTAVDGISFAIREGEVFGFLGPNGAGKTTTINVLTGLARATSGSVQIAGFDGATEIKKAQRIMGVVPDESNLYDEFDGFENLCFCAALYGMPKAEREKKARRRFSRNSGWRRRERSASGPFSRTCPASAGFPPCPPPF